MPIVATPPLKPAPSGLALALMTVISASSALATPPTYRVEVVGRGLQGFDMNASLTVVGRAVDAQGIGRAFVARRGTPPRSSRSRRNSRVPTPTPSARTASSSVR